MKLISLFLFVLMASRMVLAFPSAVRHGYTSCMTCHYSPTGGGILRPYGKIIAGELFGAFNNSASALPWVKKPTEAENWTAMIMARGANIHVNNAAIRRGEWKTMQFDAEVGAMVKNFVAFVTGGIRGSAANDATGQNEADLTLRRYFVGYQTTQFSIRAGHFYPEFGIRHPHHNIPTRGGLYFDQGEEANGVQAHVFLENFDIAVSYFDGDKETAMDDFTGYSANFLYKTEHSRTGISYINWDRIGSEDTDSAYGIFTQFGFLTDWYLLAEFDYRTQKVQGNPIIIQRLHILNWAMKCGRE